MEPALLVPFFLVDIYQKILILLGFAFQGDTLPWGVFRDISNISRPQCPFTISHRSLFSVLGSHVQSTLFLFIDSCFIPFTLPFPLPFLPHASISLNQDCLRFLCSFLLKHFISLCNMLAISIFSNFIASSNLSIKIGNFYKKQYSHPLMRASAFEK